MSTIKLVAGAQSAFGSLMTTDLDGLASGNSILGSTAFDNDTNQDLWIVFSFKSGGSITAAGTPYIAVYEYLLNGDGSTYGDGRFGSTTSGPPGQSYLRGYTAAIPTGARQVFATLTNPFTGDVYIRLPRGSTKYVFHNGLGVNLSANSNILYYRTTNLQVV